MFIISNESSLLCCYLACVGYWTFSASPTFQWAFPTLWCSLKFILTHHSYPFWTGVLPNLRYVSALFLLEALLTQCVWLHFLSRLFAFAYSLILQRNAISDIQSFYFFISVGTHVMLLCNGGVIYYTPPQ